MKDLRNLKSTLKKLIDGDCLAGMFYTIADGLVLDLYVYFTDYTPETDKQESKVREILTYLEYLEYPEKLPLAKYYFTLKTIYDLIQKGHF